MTREEAIKGVTKLRNFATKGTATYRALDMAIKALEADVPDIKIGEWISTSKKLPELDQPVLVWVNGDYWLAELNLLDDVLYWDLYMFELAGEDFNDVVAWMSLPQPYKGD